MTGAVRISQSENVQISQNSIMIGFIKDIL